MSERATKDHAGKPSHVSSTGTPAEDREDERAHRLWDLKEEAKWGKDMMTQKKAIEELSKIGTPAVTYLEEILSVVPPGELSQYCQNVIKGIGKPSSNEMRGSVERPLETKVGTPE